MMERNERLKAANKCASRYTDKNEARIARSSFMLGCEFEAQGEAIKGVNLSTLESEKPMQEGLEEEIKAYQSNRFGLVSADTRPVTLSNYFTTENLREIARHFAKWGAEHAKIESEKPMVQDGLEEELDRFIASGKSVTVDDYGTYKVSYHDFKKVAHHFAEWQKAKDDRYVDTIYQQGIEKGKDDMKEQMMKEAYDGEFFYNPYPGIALDDCKDYDFKQREDVRVIILPKED